MFEMTPFNHSQHYLGSYDPFKAMEEFKKTFFDRQLPAFKTDIRETENAFILEAELPGFSREDIHAEIKNGQLNIYAEHKSESENKDEKNNYIRKERSYGSYARSFCLDGINTDDISATYKDGILSMTLPKLQKKVEEGRKLEIS